MANERRSPVPAAVALALAFMLTGCGGQGDWPAAVAPSPTPTPAYGASSTFTLASTSVGDSYQVYVALPASYDTDTAARFPVVYLLDANWNFEPVRTVVATLAAGGQMEPVILVALCPIQALQEGYGGTAPARCRETSTPNPAPTAAATTMCTRNPTIGELAPTSDAMLGTGLARRTSASTSTFSGGTGSSMK